MMYDLVLYHSMHVNEPINLTELNAILSDGNMETHNKQYI